MQHRDKAAKIKLLALDVDGILTTGHLYYTNQDIETKAFHIQDGLGLKLLQQAGIAVAIISGKTSPALKRRLKELHIKHSYLDQTDKLPAYESLKATLALRDDEIAYMGDDLPDLPLLTRVGFSASVPDAYPLILQHVDYITEKKGGWGAVREVCDYLLKAQSRYDSVIESYLKT